MPFFKMDGPTLSQSPFALVTFVVAPAMLTNASSVLAMSTINRLLRTRDRMSQLFAQSENSGLSQVESDRLVVQTNRVERQAILLLRAMRAIYVALGSFAAATLVTLLGAMIEQLHAAFWFRALSTTGTVLGVIGVSGLTGGTLYLFQATRISLFNISDEASLIRQRQARRSNAGKAGPHPAA